MKKIIYLKLELHNEILSVCKIVDKKGTLTAHKNDLCFYPDKNMYDLKSENGFKEATREEFDNFYISTAEKFNKLSNI